MRNYVERQQTIVSDYTYQTTANMRRPTVMNHKLQILGVCFSLRSQDMTFTIMKSTIYSIIQDLSRIDNFQKQST